MSVKNSVFASSAERANFYKLSRTWGDKYHIHHNLPFLNVFGVENLIDESDWRNPQPFSVSDLDFARLKKTSIDYTLCDQKDSPIVCVEFDGMQQGFNVGTRYRPDVIPSVSPWRQEITDLKLRVAHGSRFPYFVVASKHFSDVSSAIKLTMVDGIIGEIVARRASDAKFSREFDPREIGLTQEQFNALPEHEQHDLVQDWVLDVEIDADLEHNPITQKVAQLSYDLDAWSCSHHYVEYPSADGAKTTEERIRLLDNAILIGSRVTLHTTDLGDIQADAWLPNFKVYGFSGLDLTENLAMLFALDRLKVRREGQARQLRATGLDEHHN